MGKVACRNSPQRCSLVHSGELHSSSSIRRLVPLAWPHTVYICPRARRVHPRERIRKPFSQLLGCEMLTETFQQELSHNRDCHYQPTKGTSLKTVHEVGACTKSADPSNLESRESTFFQMVNYWKRPFWNLARFRRSRLPFIDSALIGESRKRQFHLENVGSKAETRCLDIHMYTGLFITWRGVVCPTPYSEMSFIGTSMFIVY